MSRKRFTLLATALGLVGLSAASAAPKPGETPTDKRDKAVKELVAQALPALGRHDFDTFVKLCDVPYYLQPSTKVASGIRSDRDGLKEAIARGYVGKPKFDGSKHEVRSIRTLKQAKKHLVEQEAVDAETVLGDGGLVVHVELRDEPTPEHLRLLIRVKDGQYRLAGIQPASKDG